VTQTTTPSPAETLHGARVDTGLPLFRPRSSVYRRRSQVLREPLPTTAATVLAAEPPGQRFEALLAATAAVLFRYLGGTEPARVVVGVPAEATGGADGAPTAEIAPTALDTAPDGTFAALRASAAGRLAAARTMPAGPTEELLAAIGVSATPNRHPLFTVIVSAEGLHARPADVRHDLALREHDHEIELEYNANVLDQATVERFARHIGVLLAAGLADPATGIGELDLLTAQEDAELLGPLAGGDPDPVDPRTLHALFEACAAQHPDAEAIVCDDRALTYAEVDGRANRIANLLRGRGAGPGTRVALSVLPSDKLLTSLLGILKTGAAVVPVVPDFPAVRNAMLVEDAAPTLAVTESAFAERLCHEGLDLLLLDDDAALVHASPDTAPPAVGSPEDTAYVMFTSGSTGRPKGVPVPHRTLVNLVRWQRDRGADPAGRRTLQRTSIGFDVSFQEVFATLGFGGSLVVAPEDVREDVSLLADFVRVHQIARVFLPPVALEQMAATVTLNGNTPTALREVIVAGEQLRVSMAVRRFFHQIDCTLDNQYGPTETHVATGHLLEGTSMRWPELPPIGRPVRNVRVYVLDPVGRPVPVGVPGEIHIGGLAPARGYLAPAASTGRFGPDPYAPVGSFSTRYRTGDLGRFLPDGSVEFLGRTDDQVKIRGYRIELGEVEAALAATLGIRQAAVTVQDVPPLGRQLTAYVVAAPSGVPEPAEIRRLLLERLPDHMVPAVSRIATVEQIPLTPTGKVDRHALSPITAPPTGEPAAAAQGEIQEVVADILARALGRQQLGRDDVFMDLGGHSLIGIQVVAQLNELFSVTLPLRSLLRGATVASLSAEIEALRGANSSASAAVAAPVAAAAVSAQKVTLPDGRTVLTPQPQETQYLYTDVFEHHTYAGGGIVYPDQGVVFDIGAHIGLFTLYALQRSPHASVYAFEPCPPLFDALGANTADLPSTRLFPFGLGDREGSAILTYYPNLTGMTSFHHDPPADRALLSGILRNLAKGATDPALPALADSAEYLDNCLENPTPYNALQRTLSNVLAETGVERVDLLKIDVQRAEEHVLAGLAEQDWPRIRQLAIEVHDVDGRADALAAMLRGRGYRVTVEQDPLHAGTVVRFVYAVRT